MVARRMIPVSPLPPRWPRTRRRRGRPGEGTHLRVGGQQVDRAHVVAEAAGAVVVLAVDVAADGSADGHLTGARQHRDPQSARQRSPHQLVEADTAVDVDHAGGSVDGVDPVQQGHVDDQAAAVLGVIAVGTAQSRAITPLCVPRLRRRRPGRRH